MGTLDWVSGLRGPKPSEAGKEFSTGGASHLIRSAEKLAASGRYDFAIEQLSVAQRLDPDNQYIQAIIDRIRIVQNSGRDGTPASELADGRSGSLSVTVGREFANGIKAHEDEQVLSPDDIHAKVRFLTNMADQYLESGSSEKAFDSLMKAYLLDPLSPYVIASEKTVLPAWKSTRTGAVLSRPDTHSFASPDQPSMAASNPGGFASPFNTRSMQQGPLSQPGNDQLRMEMLKQQKEQERVEKERSVWRDASKAPKIFGDDESSGNSTAPESASETPRPQPSGLFSKLRLGKFLE